MVDRMTTSSGVDIARMQKERLGVGQKPAVKTPTAGAAAGSASAADAVDLSGVADAGLIKEMAASAPIDTKTVDDLRASIQQGKYPLDLSRLSDKLMEAYREIAG